MCRTHTIYAVFELAYTLYRGLRRLDRDEYLHTKTILRDQTNRTNLAK